MDTIYTKIGSPVGDLLVVGSRAATGLVLRSLSMPGPRHAPAPQPRWTHEPEPFAEVADQIRAYFAGTLTRFELEFDAAGTEFQQRVWSELDRIPFGTTTSYGSLAAELALPRDRIQALGAAIGSNPLLLVRPCHRVIGADGRMRGYAGGVDRKVALLTHEGALQPTLM
jgi:methylated-DNA-[protein]-cysteine S-methyltransferase